MTEERPRPPASVPTLTEVVALPPRAVPPAAPPTTRVAPVAGSTAMRDRPAAPSAAPAAGPLPDARLMPTEDELRQHVLEAVQQQVELVLEYRVRELMSPILARVADTLVREARAELARTLREIVSRAVAAELRRQRER